MKKAFLTLMVLAFVPHFAYAMEAPALQIFGQYKLAKNTVKQAVPQINEYFKLKELALGKKFAFQEGNPSVMNLSADQYEAQFNASNFSEGYADAVEQLQNKANAIISLLSKEIDLRTVKFGLTLKGYCKNGMTEIDMDEVIYNEILAKAGSAQ